MPNKILIADDSQTICNVAEFLLRQKGYEVILAKDGEETLNLIKRCSPDLIFLDYSLPHVSGFTLCQKFKKDPVLKDIPVVILLNSGESIDQEAFTSLGCVSYILKPFSPREFLEKVEECLGVEKIRVNDNSEVENSTVSDDTTDEFEGLSRFESKGKNSYKRFVTEFKKEMEGMKEDEPLMYREMRLESSDENSEEKCIDSGYEDITQRIIDEISTKVAEKISERIDTQEIEQVIRQKVKELA